jgi:uroporphyrin-3 C-methyltransferase/uroporphyrinogen III methyltransferase/synthase
MDPVSPPISTPMHGELVPAQAHLLPRRAGIASAWIAVIALVLAAVGCALALVAHHRFEQVERELARRIQDDTNVSNEARIAAKQAQDVSLALQTREGVLESRLTDSQSQTASLQQLYQDLSRTRDDWALAEVEQIVSVASQQLQLAGNVQGALVALQSADDRLARADRPQFVALRHAIQRDMERLRALPSVDLAGNALRIDSLVSMVDRLPLLSDAQISPAPRLDAVPIDRSAAGTTGSGKGITERIGDQWRYITAEAWSEFQQLIRVREVNQPDALLLTPGQAYFVRENLKLRLLNARLALLARQEPIYRSDLVHVGETLQNYFDTRAQSTIGAKAVLRQLEASTTTIELPNLSESLNAVRNFKSGSDHG